MTLKNTDLIGFMSGGTMVPDPGKLLFGTSGVYIARGGINIPTNPNGDHGFGWFQEAGGDVDKVSQDVLWTTFTPSTTKDKYAGGRVPGVDLNNETDYSATGRNITFTLFEDATVYVRVEGLTIRYYHSGSNQGYLNGCGGYALRVDGLVDMGTLMGGFSGRTDYGYYRFFDDSRGYAIDNDDKMRIPARRMNSNETAVCFHVSTWQQGREIGSPRIGDDIGPTYAPMAFCCSSTHSLNLTAGTHTLGVDLFCSANGEPCATWNGQAYSTIQSLQGGSLTVSTVNQWDDVGSGIIDLTGTCFDIDAEFPYPVVGGTFTHTQQEAINAINTEFAVGSSGQASDQVTVNRICHILHGAGSEGTEIGKRGYSSPGNNQIVKYVNGAWTRIGASSYNSHLSGTFKCTNPVTTTRWYHGVWRQNVNARITYPLPTGYYYPVIDDQYFCEGGGGGDAGFLGGGNPPIGQDGGGGCFKAGTLITMANGSKKPIELIEVGDEILGASIEDSQYHQNELMWTTDKLVFKPKTSIVTSIQKPLRFYRHFSINNGLMLVTPEHPILVLRDGLNGFKPASNLVIGDIIFTTFGEQVKIASIEEVLDEDNYFNFGCDGSHTYLANDIVVHNTNNLTGHITTIPGQVSYVTDTGVVVAVYVKQ
jgi:hypothetical protein